MATEKLVAGAVAWTSCFGTEVNSIINGNAILSSVALDNSSNLDVFCDISISLGSITTAAGIPFLGFFLYPLNQDSTSYGDGRFGSSAAGPPPSSYFICSVMLPPSNTGVQTGMARGILLPDGAFKFVMYSSAGVTLAASANTIKYRTYNRSIA